MKLLKIFGIVAGIHVFALILIFANPGCSTSTKRSSPADTVIADTSPVVTVPNLSSDYYREPIDDGVSTQINHYNAHGPATVTSIGFNPDAAATSSDGRYSPTRPSNPVASALQSEPVTDVLPVTTYTVVRGDSLWSIAKHNGLSVSELSSANNLRASATLKVGQKLIIPGQAPETVKVAKETPAKSAVAVTTAPLAAKPSSSPVTHTVASGETLGGIARKYQVSVGSIATANNISDPAKIRPGQEIVIPGWKAPETKKTAATVAEKTPAAPLFNDAPMVIETNDSPIIFMAPPSDRPLDEGFRADAGDAPVIQVEDTGK